MCFDEPFGSFALRSKNKDPLDGRKGQCSILFLTLMNMKLSKYCNILKRFNVEMGYRIYESHLQRKDYYTISSHVVFFYSLCTSATTGVGKLQESGRF